MSAPRPGALFLCALALTSCTAALPSSPEAGSPRAIPGLTTIDTLRPTEGSDITEVLQRHADEGVSVRLPPGHYLISHTIVLRSGSSVLGSNAATRITASPEATGTLAESGLYFSLESSGSGVADLELTSRGRPLRRSSPELSTIRVFSPESRIEGAYVRNCRLLGPNLDGIRVKGGQTHRTRIEGNLLKNAGGIIYSYMGASGTRATENRIEQSAENGMSASSKEEEPASDNVVSRNTIVSPGRMGIEDWGTQNTHLTDNEVVGPRGVGISAVGSSARVEDNVVSQPDETGIEVSPSARVVSGNRVHYSTISGKATGIVVNGSDRSSTVTIIANRIIGANVAIQTLGSLGEARIQKNVVENWSESGISLAAKATRKYELEGNRLTQNMPPASPDARAAVIVDEGPVTLRANAVVMNYTHRGPSGPEFAVKLGNVKVVDILDNVLDAAQMHSTVRLAIGTGGARASEVRIAGNQARGEVVIETNFISGMSIEDNLGLVQYP
ncbi:right-handed parallel beta-helix repeat-containing protein [Piscicoccus intestinalis]|uniref:right-handed parallel beta-helix repeat-containing protein n=1 Tax=Piscicoccus intestinalis TaxID=746033 RepID=UPI000A05DD3A|nr:right-handed parallel beta-helix repeat-containing protein [Piscicoccus intestinalis]